MKRLRHLIILIVPVCLANCTELIEDRNEVKYTNPIRIGFLGPFSDARMESEGKYLGAYLAAEEINKAGGILGRDIQLVVRNDDGSAETGIKEATKFHNEGIDIILGADWSSVTLPVAKAVTIPNQMLLMSYSSTNPTITDLNDSDLVWRTCPSDLFQGKIGAIYCMNYLHKQTASILAFNNPWSLGLSKTFQQNFESIGGTASYFGKYPEFSYSEASKFDYTPYLDSVFKTKPDIVYLASFASDGTKITNDIAKNKYITPGYNPVIFANDGLYTSYFLINANHSVTQNFFGTVPGMSLNDANYNKYHNNFLLRFGYKPVAFSEYAYDAVYLIAYSILKSNGSLNTKQIASVLRRISGTGNSGSDTKINVAEFSKAAEILKNGGNIDYDGATGNIDFDKNGDPSSGTYLIWKVNDGAFVTDTVVIFP